MTAHKTRLSLAVFTAVLSFSFQALSSGLTDEYLEGKWALDGGGCDDAVADSKFVIFRKSGAIEEVRDGRLQASGFWTLDDDAVTANVIASPAFFHDDTVDETVALKKFEGEYYDFRIQIMLYDVEADQFSAIGILDEQISRSTFNRCKA